MAKKILLVDDEPYIVLLVSQRLKTGGYEVVTAKDGEEGLEKARAENPDLIILDLMMPKMDGYEVCSTLKSDERYQKIPILIFTAKADEENKRIGLDDCGADGYLTKPFEPEALLARVKEIVNE